MICTWYRPESWLPDHLDNVRARDSEASGLLTIQAHRPYRIAGVGERQNRIGRSLSTYPGDVS